MVTASRWIRALLALLLLTLGPSPSLADSWALPEVTTYNSPNERFRLTVTPRPLESQLDYFADKVAQRKPAGQRAGSAQATAQGVLERREVEGRWTRIWAKPLRNEVAPVDALVSNDGRFAVTIDNWHLVGWGDDVVVIYGADGEVIRSLALSDFLSREHIGGLSRSVSSIHWGGEHRLSEDGNRLVLKVTSPGQESVGPDRRYQDIEIDLATGRPITRPAVPSHVGDTDP